MRRFHQRKLPDRSALLAGHAPPDDLGFASRQLQIWYNNTAQSWVGAGETPHKHTVSDECFIVLAGSLLVDVDGERFEVGPRQFCCFPAGIYHAILEVRPPVETFMIRAASVDDKTAGPRNLQAGHSSRKVNRQAAGEETGQTRH